MSVQVKKSEKNIGDFVIGTLTLDRPKVLNAMNFDMYKELASALEEWRGRDEVVCLFLDSSSERSFCAGGDVKWVTQNLHEEGVFEQATEFFALEYYVDYMIRTYPKPIVCWATGITMGAGIGMMNGCSHRVVTETSQLAMPEVKIGFFPDVGSSYFLKKLPAGVGLFMGLTAAKMSGADSLAISLADHYILSEQKADVVNSCEQIEWSGDGERDKALLTETLDRYSKPSIVNDAEIMDRLVEIGELMDQDTLKDIDSVLRDWDPADEYFKTCKATYEEASPTSVNVFYELMRKAPRDLKEIYLREWTVAVKFCSEATDFVEGVRAVLIDKDNDPKWTPSKLSRVKGVDKYFETGILSPIRARLDSLST